MTASYMSSQALLLLLLNPTVLPKPPLLLLLLLLVSVTAGPAHHTKRSCCWYLSVSAAHSPLAATADNIQYMIQKPSTPCITHLLRQGLLTCCWVLSRPLLCAVSNCGEGHNKLPCCQPTSEDLGILCELQRLQTH
jgi:hypothetical protein